MVPAAAATVTTTTTTTASLVSGYKVQLVPSLSPGKDYRITVKRNLWLQGTPEHELGTYTDTGAAFPLRLQSKVTAKGSQVILFDTGMTPPQPCAVLRKNDPQNPDKFHVFGFVPYVPNQKPSITMKYDDGRPLYTWGSLAKADSMLTNGSTRKFHLTMHNGWQYTAEREGSSGGVRGFFQGRNDTKPKHYAVKVATHSTTVSQRNVRTTVGKGSSYASIQETGQDWNVHVQAHSNHDPGLMVAFALLIDELHRSRM